jgi:hypothetical protein
MKTFWTTPLVLLAALAATPHASAADAAGLAPLKVQGSHLNAGGKPIVLRGLDWGWWHLMGTRYSEVDMRNVAQWGANVVRLSFSYDDLETDASPTQWKEDGFKDLDQVVQWGKKYGVYVMLDMHVVPGGQNTAAYVVGGQNLLWTDAGAQERFIGLWKELARRYRDRPEVAGYELVNEPATPMKHSELLRAIDQRAIDAIRAIDPDKMIVVGGDQGSGPGDLTDAMKFADNNILYTFHWYVGAGGNEDWISTERQDGIASAADWVRTEKTVTAPPGADHMSVILRSIGNTGSAWFDDVQVTDGSGNVLLSSGFDAGAQRFHPEAQAETMSYDSTVGHDKLGSLKESQSTEFNAWAGWVSDRLPTHPGEQYRVSAWVKLDHATGSTYLGAYFFRVNTQLDPDQFQKRIAPAAQFAKKFNVPVWVGEFGCDASSKDLQPKWVNACISLFEQNGFSWTYWNDKETSDPNGMGVQAEHSDGSDYPVNDHLLGALRAGWARNRP